MLQLPHFNLFKTYNPVAALPLSLNIRNTPQGVDMRMPDKYSSPTAYAWGLITSAFGVLSLDQWAIVAGIICTVGTFLVNWYYKRKEFQLKAGEHHE